MRPSERRYGYKRLAVITAGYISQKVDTKSYRVTAHLTFPDPKHEIKVITAVIAVITR